MLGLFTVAEKSGNPFFRKPPLSVVSFSNLTHDAVPMDWPSPIRSLCRAGLASFKYGEGKCVILRKLVSDSVHLQISAGLDDYADLSGCSLLLSDFEDGMGRLAR